MFTEFRKSIESVFNERLSSPLFGSFILSWFIWNWHIIYFIIISNHSPLLRIAYINLMLANRANTIGLPLLSTLLIVGIYPFLSSGVYWFHLQFDKWKYERKLEEENKTVLDLETSFILRRENIKIQEEAHNIVKEKEQQVAKVIGEITEERTQIESRINEITVQRDASERDLTTLRESQKTLLSRIDQLETANRDFLKSNSNLQMDVSDYKKENERLKKDIGNKEERFITMQEGHKRQTAELSGKVKELEEMIAPNFKITENRLVIYAAKRLFERNELLTYNYNRSALIDVLEKLETRALQAEELNQMAPISHIETLIEDHFIGLINGLYHITANGELLLAALKN